MKRFLIILAAILAIILGAAFLTPFREIQDHVTFYYAQSDFSYASPEGVIGAEIREVNGRCDDLPYLLALYLEGPLAPSLTSPFPGKGTTQILELERKDQVIEVKLSNLDVTMTDSQFSLACACLTKTCLGLTDAQAVKINSGSRCVTMDHHNLMVFDESASVQLPQQEDTT